MTSNSNACIPVSYPVTKQVPGLPNTIRGEPCCLDGESGRISSGKTFLSYTSGKTCVIRSLKPGGGEGENLPNSKSSILVYRGHQYATSCVKISTSGAYACSGDTRGKLRIWALDHEEHLCKLETQALSSTVRDISWDGESKRIAFAGDRLDNQSVCTRIIQWDTGTNQGSLSQHLKGKSCAVAFKPNRPFRLATGGKEDMKIHFHKGPPFTKIPVEDGAPCEHAHVKGINCVRYSSNGELVASVGGDKSLCIYDGKNLALKTKLENIHTGTIYACAWAADNKCLMTSSADGTCKLFEVTSADGTSVQEKHTWNVAEHMLGGEKYDKAPRGGMQLGCAFAGGTTPVSVATNNQISILPMPGQQDNKKIEILTGHNAPIGAVAFDQKNGLFFTADSDGIICKWDLKKLNALERIIPADNKELSYQVHKGAISAMTVLKDSRLVSMGWDDTAHYTKDGKLQSESLDITAQPIAVSTGTSLTAILTVKGVMLLKDGKQVSKGILPLSYEANCILISKDDKTIYVGGDDCKIYVYSSELKEKHVITDGHLKPIHSFALSNDGTMLAAGDTRDVCVYKTADYSTVVKKGKWGFHLQKITTLAWSQDDKVVASGGSDDSIYLWNIATMKRLHYQFAHRGGVVGLVFKEGTSGMNMISVGKDSCAVEWDFTEDAKKKFG
jgi:WD40 repeat protein